MPSSPANNDTSIDHASIWVVYHIALTTVETGLLVVYYGDISAD